VVYRRLVSIRPAAALLAVLWCFQFCSPLNGDIARAASKTTTYWALMFPEDDTSGDFVRPGWGGGVRHASTLPLTGSMLSVVLGSEGINLQDTSYYYYDADTYTWETQHTDLNYYRLYIGGQIGGQGGFFLRPYVGMSLSLVVYHVSSAIEFQRDDSYYDYYDDDYYDDYDDYDDYDQTYYLPIGGDIEYGFAYDLSVGLDLNLGNVASFEGGIRRLKSFDEPRQLGYDAITVHPAYRQYYVGVGLSF